jgi:hypothetical protein
MKNLIHKLLRVVFMGLVFLLRKTDDGNGAKVCLVCNYPNGGNSICGEACKTEHMNRERFSQTKAFWRELETNPQSKLDYMKLMGMDDEQDYQQRKMKYLG